MLFAAAPRIVEFAVLAVADLREEIGVEEGTVVGELRQFIAVAKAPGGVAHLKAHGHDVACCQWRVQCINRVEVARCAAHEVKRTVEGDMTHRLLRVGDVNLRDGRRGFVLQDVASLATERTLTGIDIDGGINGSDLGLGQQLVLLVPTFVIGGDGAPILGIQVLVEDVRIIEKPAAGADGNRCEH